MNLYVIYSEKTESPYLDEANCAVCFSSYDAAELYCKHGTGCDAGEVIIKEITLDEENEGENYIRFSYYGATALNLNGKTYDLQEKGAGLWMNPDLDRALLRSLEQDDITIFTDAAKKSTFIIGMEIQNNRYFYAFDLPDRVPHLLVFTNQKRFMEWHLLQDDQALPDSDGLVMTYHPYRVAYDKLIKLSMGLPFAINPTKEGDCMLYQPVKEDK